MSDSLPPQGLKHARLPCSSPSPRICSGSYPLIGEGNGNPLQCSCLEGRTDGAWWAAIYGVPQSRTRLKWLSSSSMSIELVMPSNHLILCRPLLLLPSISPSIRVFPNESALLMRWPKYWSFSFSISPSNDGLVWYACSPRDSQESSSALQFESISSLAFYLLYDSELSIKLHFLGIFIPTDSTIFKVSYMVCHPALCDLASAAFMSLTCDPLPCSTLHLYRLWFTPALRPNLCTLLLFSCPLHTST